GLLVRQAGKEEPWHLPLLHDRQLPLVTVEYLDTQGIGQVGADHHALAIWMRSQDRKRVAMFGSHQGVYIGVARHQRFPWHGQGRATNHWNLHRKAVVPRRAIPVAGRATRLGGSPLRK